MNNSRQRHLTKKIKAVLNNCLSRLLLVLLLGVIASTVLSSRLVSQASNGESSKAAQSKESKNPRQHKHVDMARKLAASYYSLKDGLSATLMLSNQGPHPMDIRVVLFSLAGERLDLPTFTLEPTTVRNYDLRQWAATGGGSFQEGSLQVLYNGMDMELGGAVKMINAKKSLILDEELSEPGMDFASTRLEGVWWLPSRKAELRLALSNVTNSYLTTTVTVEQNDAKTLTLSPHETRIINLSRGEGDFGGVKLRQFGGVSISHLGFKGALLARGFVTDAKVGYSQVVEFKDPGVAKSSALNGAGLRLGTLNGKALHPVAVARNTGSAPTIVTGRIRYTAGDGTSGVVNLPEVDLAAGETKTIDVETAANSIGSLQNLVVGLEFDYTSAPGSVIIAAESYSTDDNQVYRVSVIDALAQMSSTGKYPWNLSNGASTVVYIKNVTDQEQQYYLYANYKGGFWIQGVKTIAPHQTFSLDMRQIKEQQIKDEKGNTLPADAMEGQVFWSGFGEQNLVLIGRVEQIEAGGGMSFTTACGTCCFPEFIRGIVLPSTATDVVGDSTQFYAYNQYSDCYGVYYPSLTGASRVSWSTTDPTIATINISGLATAKGAGTTTIVADWTAPDWEYNSTAGCDPDTGFCGGFAGGGSSEGGGPMGACQNQPVDTSAGASYSGVKVDILLNGNPVTGQTLNVIIGQGINLTTSVQPANASVSNSQWTVPGTDDDRIADFVVVPPTDDQHPNPTNGTVVNLSNFTNSSVNFYWVSGGNNRTVQYSVNVNGKNVQPQVTFNVNKPTGSIQISTGTISVDSNFNRGFALHFGNVSTSGTPGITFTPSYTPALPGAIEWVQIANASRTVQPNVGTQLSGQASGLDSVYPYPTAGYPTADSTEDSPANGFSPCDYTSATAADNFTMWLMFKPNVSSGTSIWVPLRAVSWSWTASASRTAGTCMWTLNGTPTKSATDSDTTTYPQWTNNIQPFVLH